MQLRLGRMLEWWRGDSPCTKLLGVSCTFARSMKRGTRFPPDRELLKIAERLRLGPDELFFAT